MMMTVLIVMIPIMMTILIVDCDNHLKPSKEEGKLDGEKEWIEQVQLRLCVSHWQAVSLLNKTS